MTHVLNHAEYIVLMLLLLSLPLAVLVVWR